MEVYHPQFASDNMKMHENKNDLPAKHKRNAGNFNASIAYYPESFLSNLEAIIAASKDGGDKGALLIIELDNLAMVIRGYGYDIAEEVIKSLQEAIGKILPDSDEIIRVQRDQIGVILKKVKPGEERYVRDRIHSVIRHFGYDSCYGSLHLNASIACLPLDSSFPSVDKVLGQVYIDLDKNSESSISSAEDYEKEAAYCRQEMGLASYLNKAIKENRLRLAFQPVIESTCGEVSHYEALLRVVGEDGTLSSVGAFIPIAERMGLIHIIDRLVLEMVVEEVKRAPNLSLAFNVSNLTTEDDTWINNFKDLIADRPDVASRLIVEITETAIHRDLKQTASFVATVQAFGAQVALDDFGSGYTSFRQLKTLSLDVVKIDGAFVRDLADNADNRFFVKTLLEFTRGFGLKTVAEFVENGEIAKMLMELGVSYMQGYYFGRPETHRRWLQN